MSQQKVASLHQRAGVEHQAYKLAETLGLNLKQSPTKQENTMARNKRWDDTSLLPLGAHILGDNSFAFQVIILIKEA